MFQLYLSFNSFLDSIINNAEHPMNNAAIALPEITAIIPGNAESMDAPPLDYATTNVVGLASIVVG